MTPIRTAAALMIGASLITAVAARAADLVANTEAQTPEQERAMFHLPPGFEIQLVACEDDIHKPMNINFDARGRLWVTHSVEYPFPVKPDETGRDKITILSDIGPDGRARSIHDFATGLNIPIGVVPLGDGSEAIAWSVPTIWKFRDADGDGVADTREPLLTGFEYVDTHGDQNGFTRWLDGWIYANHGFRNHSRVQLRGQGPVVLDMPSGNTYRFRPDGSAAEHLTHGQVNPFGVCFDEWGYRYSADCHSMPVYQLINGADYPSFGRPADALGFAPKMIDHNHGSTGIGGIAFYLADRFPAEYRGNLFLGNVVTGRVHRDIVEWHGSTPQVHTQPDFITCDDPWFHPVDIQLGPDGALYLNDFYAPIIGHYEVPLNHPKRDRTRGRIWRVVWKGADGKAEPPTPMPDLTKLPIAQLVDQLNSDNLTVRTLATNQIVDRGDEAINAAMDAAKKGDASPQLRAHALWAAYRGTGEAKSLEGWAGADTPALVRANLMRAWGEFGGDGVASRLRAALNDQDVHVRRAAVEALARHPDAENVAPLLKLWAETPGEDTHLIHACKIALRENLKDEAVFAAVEKMRFDDSAQKRLLDVVLAVPGDTAARFVFAYAQSHNVDQDVLVKALPAVARTLPVDQIHLLARFVRTKFGSDAAFQLALFTEVEQALLSRGVEPKSVGPGELMKVWAIEVTDGVLLDEKMDKWQHVANPDTPDSADPWGYEKRKCADGREVEVMSSHAHGEKLTGVLRSQAFLIPKSLSFYLCGHNGFPNTPDNGKNRIVLRLSEDDSVIAEQTPPRNDTAKQYTWDLTGRDGKFGYLEVIDGDTADAYAWLAFGRLDPPVIAMPAGEREGREKRVIEALRIAGEYERLDMRITILKMARDTSESDAVRVAAMKTAYAIAMATKGHPSVAHTFRDILNDGREAVALRSTAGALLAEIDDETIRGETIAALSTVPEPVQKAIATGFASSRAGGEALLGAIRSGKASPRLLLDTQLVERLRSAKVDDVDKRVGDLTQGLTPLDEHVRQMIAQRRDAFGKTPRDPAKGKAAFGRICAACHQMEGVGNRIGPQLDGIGVRGLDRLLEDVMDPSRNVDEAFRMNIVTMKDGSTVVGLGVREEGKSLILADTAGKEQRVQLDNIAERRIANMSLMPPNLVDTMSESDFLDLIAYLLSQGDSK